MCVAHCTQMRYTNFITQYIYLSMETLEYITPLSVGETVPEDIPFKIFHAGDIRDTSIGAYRGKWLVLFFYPGDFTFICPTELGELASRYAEFQKEGVEVISMSTDTAFSHKVWHETSETIKTVQFPMGSDHRHEFVDAFNIYCEEDGLAYRATIIIDPEGVVTAMEINANAIGRSTQELLRKVQAARHVRENPGQVCPASWEQGGKTLSPSTDLVGKI